MKRVAISITAGVLVTFAPFAFALSSYGKGWFELVASVCDWPMLLVQRHFPFWVHGREGDRLIIFFFVNVVAWALLAELIMRILTDKWRRAAGKSYGN